MENKIPWFQTSNQINKHVQSGVRRGRVMQILIQRHVNWCLTKKRTPKHWTKSRIIPLQKILEKLWPVLIISHTSKYQKKWLQKSHPILVISQLYPIIPQNIPTFCTHKITGHIYPIHRVPVNGLGIFHYNPMPTCVSAYNIYIYPPSPHHISLENHHLDDPNELTSKYEDVSMMLPWFSHDFLMMLTWSSLDVNMIFPCFLMMLTWCSHDFLINPLSTKTKTPFSRALVPSCAAWAAFSARRWAVSAWKTSAGIDGTEKKSAYTRWCPQDS